MGAEYNNIHDTDGKLSASMQRSSRASWVLFQGSRAAIDIITVAYLAQWSILKSSEGIVIFENGPLGTLANNLITISSQRLDSGSFGQDDIKIMLVYD